jgi:hypothetical protein
VIIDPAGFVTWATMRPLVLSKISECPSFVIDRAMKLIAREFFEDSRVWRSAHDVLLTTATDTKEYLFVPPANAEVVAVQSAWLNDEELKEATPGMRTKWPESDTCSYPRIGARPTNILYLTAKPAIVDTEVKGTLSFMPADDAEGIPIEAWSRWQNGLASGAAARLVTEPNKPWSNPTLHDFLWSEFLRAVSEASMTAGPTRRISLRSEAV